RGKGGRKRFHGLWGRPGSGGSRRAAFRWPAELLQHPAVLWLSIALALMVSAVILCLSRGGVAALVVGAAVGGAVWLSQSRRAARTGALLVGAALIIGLVLWLGLDRLEARWAPLWQTETSENRLALWARSLPLVKTFPL